MRTTALLVAALASLLSHALPAQAQIRVFVSGSGSDSNPCTFASPCRSFQQAFNTAPVNGEIDVLDPAGYGALTITHGISIQAHGFGGITQAAINATAINVSAGTSDAITLNGLLIDGAGTGEYGIVINSGGSVQILNCVIRNFELGILDQPTTESANLLIADTVASDNSATGIMIDPMGGGTPVATLSRITANNNPYGVRDVAGTVMIANSVLSNNSYSGLFNYTGTTTWLAKSVISGNGYDGEPGASGVYVYGGQVNSYGDNAINGNATDIYPGSLTKVSTE